MNIQTKDFLNLVEEKITEYYKDYKNIEIIQVWYCKTIQNHKGIFIIRNNEIHEIYPYFVEATYNGDKSELYLDFYTKQNKMIYSIERA